MLSWRRQLAIDNYGIRINDPHYTKDIISPFLVKANGKIVPIMGSHEYNTNKPSEYILVIPPYFRVEIRQNINNKNYMRTFCPMLSTRIIDNLMTLRLYVSASEHVGVNSGLYHDACDFLTSPEDVHVLQNTSTSFNCYLENINTALTDQHEPQIIEEDKEWFVNMCMGYSNLSISNVPHTLWTPGSTQCNAFMKDFCNQSHNRLSNPVCSCVREQDELGKSENLPSMVTCYGETCMSTGYIFENMRSEMCGSTMCTQQTNGLQSITNTRQNITLTMNCGTRVNDQNDTSLSRDSLSTTTIKKDHIFSNPTLWFTFLVFTFIIIIMCVVYINIRYIAHH